MERFGPWLTLSVIALVALMGLILISRKLLHLISDQNQMIQRLSNLAASKDLAAFTTLQAPNESVFAPVQFAPMDDASVAERLASAYSDNGVDPAYAYAQDPGDDADFGPTFG